MRLAVFLLPVLIAACSGEAEEPGIVPERDPMATQALNDQIMVDPDLAQQNEANAALSGNSDHSLPPIVATREAIEGAKLEAADLVGGTANLRPLSDPKAAEPLPEAALYSVTELAKLTNGAADCAEKASFTASWAAKMPAVLPIYPRGNTIEAAGSDSSGCKLRAVRFITPVTRADVLAFYAASARKGGLNATYSRAGDFEVLEGSEGGNRYAIYLRRRQSGISEVVLVTIGF